MTAPTLSALGIGRLFDVVPDAVIVGDTSTGTVVAWNDGAQEVFGYTREQADGMPLHALVPPELRDAHLGGLARYADGAGGTLTSTRELVEVPALRSDGSQIWIELRLAPIALPGDERRYVLAACRDVSTRRAAQQQAQEALEAARAANASLQDFVAVAAHDLRAPLSGVAGAIDLLHRQYERLNEEQRREMVGIARRQAMAMSALLEDLLDLSRIDAGAVDAHKVAVDVQLAVEEVVATLSATVDVAVEDGVTILGDASHVRRCLTNLIANAMKYGRPPVTVRVSVDDADHVAVIAVEDHGPGVPEELEGRLFERFSRAPGTGQPGAGLGLAIVAGLAEANGATVSHQNTATGARFALRWPLIQPLSRS